jgi:hypothetical protein
MTPRLPQKKASPRPIARATTSRPLVAGQRTYTVLPSAALILGLLGSAALSGCGVDEVRADESTRRPHAAAASAPSETTAPSAATAPVAPSTSSTMAGNPDPIDIPPVPAAQKAPPTLKAHPPIAPKKHPVQIDGGLGVVMPRDVREPGEGMA